MQNDTPVNGNTLSDESVIGNNFELLILHKAYLDLTEDEDEKEKQEEEEKK